MYEDSIAELSSMIEKSYSELTTERFDIYELESMITEYLDWASSEIASNGTVNFNSVSDKLEELGFEKSL